MTPAQRKRTLQRLVSLQGGSCCYCDRQIEILHHTPGRTNPPHRATLEHLRRKCEGGTDHLDNLAAACFECNGGRGLTDWLTFKSYRMGETVTAHR